MRLPLWSVAHAAGQAQTSDPNDGLEWPLGRSLILSSLCSLTSLDSGSVSGSDDLLRSEHARAQHWVRSRHERQDETTKLLPMVSHSHGIDGRPHHGATWPGQSAQCGRTCSLQIRRGSTTPSQIPDKSESQDELAVGAILAGRSCSGTHSLPGVWTRDQKVSGPQPHTHSSTTPARWIPRDPPSSLTPARPTILLPLLRFTSWSPGRWHQPPRVLPTHVLPAPYSRAITYPSLCLNQAH